MLVKEDLRKQIRDLERIKVKLQNESETSLELAVRCRSAMRTVMSERDWYQVQYQDMKNQQMYQKFKRGEAEKELAHMVRRKDHYEASYRHEGTKNWLFDIENDKLTRANDVLIHQHEQDVKVKASLAKALTELREKFLAMETKAAATEAKLEKFMSETNNK